MLAIYCRISGNKAEGKDTSIEIQQAEGIKVAIRLGLKYKIYTDIGISGAKDEIEDRPEFAEMLKDIEKDIIKSVFCIDQSRIERNSRIWQYFQYQVIKKDVRYYPNGQYLDLADPTVKVYTGIQSIMNTFFSEETRRKVNLTFDRRAEEGYTHGIIPYGYKKGIDGKYEIYEKEAINLRRIFDMSLSGIGTYTIANIFNSEKIPTKIKSVSKKKVITRKDSYTGEKVYYKTQDILWRGNVIYDMITNTSYKGLKFWNKRTKKINGQPSKKAVIQVPIPAIFDEEYFDKVNANLLKNKQQVGKRSEFNYLLNGLITCGCCGSEYRGKKRLSQHDSSYKCKQIGKCPDSRGISITKLENFIITHLFLDKNLQRLLSELPVNEEQSITLKTQLKKYEEELIKKNKLKTRYLLWSEDEDLSNDLSVLDKYKQAKRDVENLTQNIETVKMQIQESNNEFIKNRLNNTINSYNITASFQDTKRLIHSIIENVTIKHYKQVKSGYYLISINYKGFDETSIFMTNWMALNWEWLRYYRNGATTPEQLEEDIQELKDLYDFKGIEYNDSDFIGFVGTESSTSMHQTIKLDVSNYIKFD